MKKIIITGIIALVIFSLTVATLALGGFSFTTEAKGMVGHWSLAQENETKGDTEFITNGGFDTDTIWSKAGSWTISGGTANKSASSDDLLSHGTVFTIANIQYVITYQITSISSGEFHATIGDAGVSTTQRTEVGTYTEIVTANTSANLYMRGTGVGSIDNVSVVQIVQADLTGNGNEGSPVFASGVAYTTDQKGNGNSAITFNGSTDLIDTGSDMIGTTALTVSAWINANSGGESNEGRIVANGKTWFRLIAGSTVSKLAFSSAGTTNANSADDSINHNTWYHVLVTRTSAGVTNFYINGVSSGAVNQAGSTPKAGTTNVTIGNNTTATQTFDGEISDVRIYNYALTPEEVRTLSQSYNPNVTVGDKGLVGEWGLGAENESKGTSLIDYSFTTNTTGDWTQVGTTISWDTTGFLRATFDDGTANKGIIQTPLTAGVTYLVNFRAKSDRSVIFTSIGDNLDLGTVISNPTLTTNWQDYAFVITPTAVNFRLYVDGGSGGDILDFDDIIVSPINQADLSGNGNNGTPVVPGGVVYTTDRKGNGDSAITFDGTTDYVEVADTNDFSFGNGTSDEAFSISAWVNMTDATNFHIINKGVYNTDGEWNFRINSSDYLGLHLYDESVASTFESALTASTLSVYEGQWVHLVGTYDGRGGTSANAGISLYINGVAQSVTLADAGTYVAMENLTHNVWVGTDGTTYSEGSISDTKIYNKELSPSEVRTLYQEYDPELSVTRGELDKGLVGAWDLSKEATAGGVYENTVDGTASIASTDAYGTWEWDVYKGVDGNGILTYFTSNTFPVVTGAGYYLQLSTTEALGIGKAGVGNLLVTATSYIAINQWYHVKVDRTSAGAFSVYLDGTLVDPTGGSGTNPVTDNTYTSSAYMVLDLDAGDKIKNIITPSGPIKPSDFTAGTGTYTNTYSNDSIGVIYDLTGNRNNGGLVSTSSASAFTTDRKGNGDSAISFNGIGDNVSIVDSLKFGTGSGSFSLWMKSATTISANSALYKTGRDGTNPSIAVFVSTTGKLTCNIEDDAANATGCADDAADIDDSLWHHIVVVYDRTNNLMKRYVDGIPSGTNADISSVTGSTDSTDSDRIGAGRSATDVTNAFFPGSISDVRIYNRALSAEEIRTLYNLYE